MCRATSPTQAAMLSSLWTIFRHLDADEQIAATERALTEAKAQRDRDGVADGIEAMAAAIEKAVPGFEAGSAGLLAAVTNSTVVLPEATKFSDSVDALRREVVSAAQ